MNGPSTPSWIHPLLGTQTSPNFDPYPNIWISWNTCHLTKTALANTNRSQRFLWHPASMSELLPGAAPWLSAPGLRSKIPQSFPRSFARCFAQWGGHSGGWRFRHGFWQRRSLTGGAAETGAGLAARLCAHVAARQLSSSQASILVLQMESVRSWNHEASKRKSYQQTWWNAVYLSISGFQKTELTELGVDGWWNLRVTWAICYDFKTERNP